MEKLLPFGILMVLLLVIAMVAIGLILSPATVHERIIDQSGNSYEKMMAQSALTADGLLLRVEAWKEYPEYNIGLGVIAGIAFAGAIYTCKTMYSLRDGENEAP